jgi:hypothetical protein
MMVAFDSSFNDTELSAEIQPLLMLRRGVHFMQSADHVGDEVSARPVTKDFMTSSQIVCLPPIEMYLPQRACLDCSVAIGYL